MRFSEKLKITVVGPWSLNNSYLGVHLELEGFKVDYLEFPDFAKTSPKKPKNYFGLIDFECEQETAIFSALENIAQTKDPTTIRYALFNVCPDQIKPGKMFELAQKGLAGIFFNGEELEKVCRGVRMILDGTIWFPRKLMEQMILGSNEDTKPSDDQICPATLTLREKEVLAKLASGLSNQEIAEQLFISIPTVKMHISNIYEKIGVASRIQAALWLAKNG